ALRRRRGGGGAAATVCPAAGAARAGAPRARRRAPPAHPRVLSRLVDRRRVGLTRVGRSRYQRRDTPPGKDVPMRMRALISFVLGALLLPGVAGAADPVRLGVIQPLTGPVAYDGTIYVNTLKMIVEEMNAKGGVLGRPIELVVEDGACNPAQSVNAAEKLV